MSRKRRTVADEAFLLVRSSSSELASEATIPNHVHGWHQLVYIVSGLMAVDTARGSWIAPPDWAVWVPAHHVHAIRFIVRSSLRTLYVRSDPELGLPDGCCSLAVSPLLRELIVQIVEMGMLDARNRAEMAMATVMLAELDRAGPPPFTLPQPSTKATIEAARLISADGSEAGDLDAIAKVVGIGVRTLQRRFRAETGLTPGRWHQQAKLLKGLELIASGAMVKTAAAEAGFASVSAYVAAFRKLFGTTPSRYFASPPNA